MSPIGWFATFSTTNIRKIVVSAKKTHVINAYPSAPAENVCATHFASYPPETIPTFCRIRHPHARSLFGNFIFFWLVLILLQVNTKLEVWKLGNYQTSQTQMWLQRSSRLLKQTSSYPLNLSRQVKWKATLLRQHLMGLPAVPYSGILGM